MKCDNYYLDLDKINALVDTTQRDTIHRYYLDMMHSFVDGRLSMATSIFNTLNQGGYLRELRGERIDKVLS